MTVQETAKIVMVVKAVYPRFYSKLTEAESVSMIKAWAAVLNEYTYEQVNAGLQMYLKTDKNGFPPSPGQVIDGMDKAQKVAEDKRWEQIEQKLYERQWIGTFKAERIEKQPEVITDGRRTIDLSKILKE